MKLSTINILEITKISDNYIRNRFIFWENEIFLYENYKVIYKLLGFENSINIKVKISYDYKEKKIKLELGEMSKSKLKKRLFTKKDVSLILNNVRNNSNKVPFLEKLALENEEHLYNMKKIDTKNTKLNIDTEKFLSFIYNVNENTSYVYAIETLSYKNKRIVVDSVLNEFFLSSECDGKIIEISNLNIRFEDDKDFISSLLNCKQFRIRDLIKA